MYFQKINSGIFAYGIGPQKGTLFVRKTKGAVKESFSFSLMVYPANICAVEPDKFHGSLNDCISAIERFAGNINHFYVEAFKKCLEDLNAD